MLCVRVLQAVNLRPTATSNTVNPLARVCLQLPGPGYVVIFICHSAISGCAPYATKSNLVHFSLKIWHLVATILVFFFWESIQSNDQISCILNIKTFRKQIRAKIFVIVSVMQPWIGLQNWNEKYRTVRRRIQWLHGSNFHTRRGRTRRQLRVRRVRPGASIPIKGERPW